MQEQSTSSSMWQICITHITHFGRGLLNTFEATLHSAYLSLKVPASFGVILVFDSQKDVRNIEQGFAPSQKTVHLLREALEHYQQHSCSIDRKASNEAKSAMEANCDKKSSTRRKQSEEEMEKISRLKKRRSCWHSLIKNSDIFQGQSPI
jgi:hypothetical protein